MMNIRRFIKDEAVKGHGDTILASGILPEGMEAPFDHSWGYIENNSQMEGHSHPTTEIYIILEGECIVQVGEERKAVTSGDVIEIPENAYHTLICEDSGPILWAALWWDKVKQ